MRVLVKFYDWPKRTVHTVVCCLPASRYRLLESRLEETVQQTMKLKEEKISSLEKKVEESNKVNATLLAELSTVSTHATSHLTYQEYYYQIFVK